MDSNSRRSTNRADGTESTTRRRILKTGAGAVATAGILPIISGTAAAHFPEQLEIDIKPVCSRNNLNAHSSDVVPVSVLVTEFTDEDGETVRFDPTENDVRYRFGAPDVVEDGDGARPAHCGHARNETGDGSAALVLHFPMEEAGFGGDETEGKLVWERDESGEHGYAGTDDVTITDTDNGSRD